MTTKPKARKFRIRKGAPIASALRPGSDAAESGEGSGAEPPAEARPIPGPTERPLPSAKAVPVAKTTGKSAPAPSGTSATAAKPGPARPAASDTDTAQKVVRAPVKPMPKAVPTTQTTATPPAAKAGPAKASAAPAKTPPPKPASPPAAAEKPATPAPEARPVPGPKSGVAPRPAPPGEKPGASQPGPDSEIDAIKREGLTGRQLRMARRVAQKHNLPATSDFDAVRLLRQRGIDPFARSNMLGLVVPPKGGAVPEEGAPDAFEATGARAPDRGDNTRIQLPQTVREGGASNLPGSPLTPAERREHEIRSIQRDILRRRQRKLMMLMTRLAFFVLLPTIVVGWYYNVMATPMYASKSEFLILQADNVGGSGFGGLLSGTQFATSQDSIATQSYLQSKDAMLRLDGDAGFKDHFTQETIDPIQRLAANPTNEAAYKVYQRNVTIGYDPTEGSIRMEVVAADPEVATRFSERLISYAEERINNLSQQKRADQMKDAMEGFQNAENERRNAQEALVQLQQQGAILDPEGVITGLRAQINNVEVQLQEKELQLAALLDNARPNQARVDGVRGDVQRLRDLLADLNARMVDASKGENSLAQLSVRIQMAQADLATRDMMLQSALQQVEQTRMEANRQVRYLTISVKPVPSEEATYPRAFENTVLAFLIFSGIYLMFSLTASILREQVTS